MAVRWVITCNLNLVRSAGLSVCIATPCDLYTIQGVFFVVVLKLELLKTKPHTLNGRGGDYKVKY